MLLNTMNSTSTFLKPLYPTKCKFSHPNLNSIKRKKQSNRQKHIQKSTITDSKPLFFTYSQFKKQLKPHIIKRNISPPNQFKCHSSKTNSNDHQELKETTTITNPINQKSNDSPISLIITLLKYQNKIYLYFIQKWKSIFICVFLCLCAKLCSTGNLYQVKNAIFASTSTTATPSTFSGKY